MAVATVTLASTVSASRQQVSSELSGEIVILDLRGGVYHGLDETGARIWQLIQEPRKVDDIRDVLLAEYNVEAAACERDLLELLQDLSAHGLVEIRQ